MLIFAYNFCCKFESFISDETMTIIIGCSFRSYSQVVWIVEGTSRNICHSCIIHESFHICVWSVCLFVCGSVFLSGSVPCSQGKVVLLKVVGFRVQGLGFAMSSLT